MRAFLNRNKELLNREIEPVREKLSEDVVQERFVRFCALNLSRSQHYQQTTRVGKKGIQSLMFSPTNVDNRRHWVPHGKAIMAIDVYSPEMKAVRVENGYKLDRFGFTVPMTKDEREDPSLVEEPTFALPDLPTRTPSPPLTPSGQLTMTLQEATLASVRKVPPSAQGVRGGSAGANTVKDKVAGFEHRFASLQPVTTPSVVRKITRPLGGSPNSPSVVQSIEKFSELAGVPAPDLSVRKQRAHGHNLRQNPALRTSAARELTTSTESDFSDYETEASATPKPFTPKSATPGSGTSKL